MVTYDLDQIVNPCDLAELLDRDDIILVTDQSYDITKDDYAKKIVMLYDGDWGIVIPNDLPESFIFSVIHKGQDGNDGAITPYGSSLVDGQPNKVIFGNSSVTLIQRSGNWIVESQQTFITEKNLGKTKNYEFINSDLIVINHNFERVPLTEVWVENECGDLIKSNIDLVHDWQTKNTFTVKFETPQSGVIIYI